MVHVYIHTACQVEVVIFNRTPVVDVVHTCQALPIFETMTWGELIGVRVVVPTPVKHSHAITWLGEVCTSTFVAGIIWLVLLVRSPDICIVKETLAPFNDVQEKAPLNWPENINQ
jgi:hypothetical protein